MQRSRIKLLVIEDDPDQVVLLEHLTTGMGYEVKSSTTGHAGLELASEFKPDVLLLDMELPDISGLKVLSSIRSNPETKDCLVIIVSAQEDQDIVVQSLAQGANDYIRKPFNNAELSMRMGNLLNLRHSLNTVQALSDKIESEKKLLSKYFSEDLIEGILNGQISTEIGGQTSEVSILICDLRSSTAMAELIEPDTLAKFLSDFFADIIDLIAGEGGSINSFRGDGFLITYGVPSSLENPALAAATTAMKIQKHIEFYNQFKPEFIKDDLVMGVGITTGKVFAGNVGSVHRLHYTVLGDAVNLAARLESLTKLAKVHTLIDGRTRDLLGKGARVRRVQLNKIRGKIQEVRVYSLDDLDGLE